MMVNSYHPNTPSGLDPRTGNWEPFLAGSVASFCPNQIENAPKLATVPVFSGVNSQRIRENWQHFGRSVASFRVSASKRREPDG
jgi:hypothetical protein